MKLPRGRPNRQAKQSLEAIKLVSSPCEPNIVQTAQTLLDLLLFELVMYNVLRRVWLDAQVTAPVNLTIYSVQRQNSPHKGLSKDGR
jgi:hypothetical protein